jgi:hypothetical protein
MAADVLEAFFGRSTGTPAIDLLAVTLLTWLILAQLASWASALLRRSLRRHPRLRNLLGSGRANFYLGAARRTSTDAPVGFKGAGLGVAGDVLVLLPLSHKAPCALDANAKCLADRGLEGSLHSMAECSCGFHAYRDLASARAHAQLTEASVLLEVVLSGEVVEHRRGFRASHQRVRAVILRSCEACPAPARAFRRSADVLLPVCGDHLGAQRSDVLTFDALSDLAGQDLPGRRPLALTSDLGATPLTPHDVTAWFSRPADAAARVGRSLRTSEVEQGSGGGTPLP